MRSVCDETKYNPWNIAEEVTWGQIDEEVINQAEKQIRDAVEFPSIMMLWNQVWQVTWRNTAGLAR